jgi:putative FmdB family regulatory protein
LRVCEQASVLTRKRKIFPQVVWLEKNMPIYEYACPNCRSVFEKWLKLSEATENAACPQCGSQAQHIISHTSFVLKGGGWYVTDYGYRKGASEDGQSAASSADATSTPSATGDSGKGAEPAPAAPADATPTPAQPASSSTSDAA